VDGSVGRRGIADVHSAKVSAVLGRIVPRSIRPRFQRRQPTQS
jgi:hypothetical protein